MSAIHDLLKQVEDPRVRERLAREYEVLAQNKKFGLVFENHLPELVPIPKATPRRGDLVAKKGASLTELWRVAKVIGDKALCARQRSGKDGATGQLAQLPADELLVVRQFGDPIFPSLVPVDAVQNGPADAPWHTLIEADNYHALQLLQYLYAGQVDCIYIDPPYNTGARDWKYNNDYVDSNDAWRHSKWLAFMERRLLLANRLLKPDTGVLVVTIDEHELLHLGMLLEDLFPQAARQVATIVINQKGVSQGRLARTEEYALFVFMPNAFLKTHHDDLLSPDRSDQKRFQTPRWEWLLRGGTNSRREDREHLFYPIHVDPKRRAIVGIGEPLPLGQLPNLDAAPEATVAWPIRTDGSFGNWQVGPPSFRQLVEQGFARLGGYDKRRRTWTVQYLNRGTRARIDAGEIVLVGRDDQTGAVQIEYASADARLRNIKSVWHRGIHDSGIYGSSLLKGILGEGSKFSFPKSLYSTRDAVAAVVRDRPTALIVDFFAGSGTTLNAVNLLNSADNGQRRCILVTNNEVSAEQADTLTAQKLQPGNDAWESQGICRAVTWPRSKFTILGRRDDDTALVGDYLTGKTREVEKPRKFVHVGFVDPDSLTTPASKKQLVRLIDNLPQNLVGDPCMFIVSAEHKASVLFDPEAADDWLAALEEADQVTEFYIVTPKKKEFDALKVRVEELLGPYTVAEEEKRPLAEGFKANLAYFRLDFLDKDRVALKRAFSEIVPLLWLRAGAIGPQPKLNRGFDEPWFLRDNPFAVLLAESRIRGFLKTIVKRKDLTHVFLVTDDGEAFKDMAADVEETLKDSGRPLTVVQLYRDYLENFMINRGDKQGARS